jgi:hypothetical protein
VGGRALLAFQRSESGPDGEATAEALLGAIMVAETQSAQIQLLEAFGKFCEAWSKTKRGGRQR